MNNQEINSVELTGDSIPQEKNNPLIQIKEFKRNRNESKPYLVFGSSRVVFVFDSVWITIINTTRKQAGCLEPAIYWPNDKKILSLIKAEENGEELNRRGVIRRLSWQSYLGYEPIKVCLI